MKKISASIDDNHHEKLSTIAAERECALSDVIREAIEFYITKDESENVDEESKVTKLLKTLFPGKIE